MDSLNQFCITRLTFCDNDLIHRGFELFYHDTKDSANPFEISAKVASFALLDYGLDQAGEKGKVILTITQSWLANANILPVAKIKDRLVLRLGCDIETDPITLSALQTIRSKGFQIALADYTPEDARTPLLSQVDIVALNCQSMTLGDLKNSYKELRKYPLSIMAQNIESWQAFEKIKTIGFDFYQGSFLAKPELLDTPKNNSNRIMLVRLITLLFDEKSSISDIEKIIEQEPTLFYRLLKFVNSAAYQLPNKIDSLHQAVIYIGTEALRTIVAILVWAKDDHKAYTVLPQILTRAKACEMLAKEYSRSPADRYFTLGFLSLLDIAMSQPLEKLILNLSVSDEMQDALLNHQGPLADILEFVQLWEKADWPTLEQHKLFSLERSPELMRNAQDWALASQQEMQTI